MDQEQLRPRSRKEVELGFIHQEDVLPEGGGVDLNPLSPPPPPQLSQIFRNVGLDLPEETFEEVWRLASEEHEAGEVCVERFCRLLKERKAM